MVREAPGYTNVMLFWLKFWTYIRGAYLVADIVTNSLKFAVVKNLWIGVVVHRSSLKPPNMKCEAEEEIKGRTVSMSLSVKEDGRLDDG